MKRQTIYKKVDEFIKQSHLFKEIISMEIYERQENFLCSRYIEQFPKKMGIHAVLETDDDLIYICDVRCGYWGTGPREAVKLIKHIFDAKKITNIEKYISRHKGLRLSREGQDVYIKGIYVMFSHKDSLLDSPFMNYSFCNFEVDIHNRYVQIFNPQLANYRGLLNLITKMGLKTFYYHIGDNSPLNLGYQVEKRDVLQMPKSQKNFYKGVKYVNIALEGKHFNIYCLINESEVFHVINSLHLILFRKNLFIYNRFGALIYGPDKKEKKTLLSFFKNQFIKRSNHKIIQGEIHYQPKEIIKQLGIGLTINQRIGLAHDE